MNKLFLILAYALCFFPEAVFCAEENLLKKEFQTLYSFYEDGAHHPDLYRRLAELAPETPLKLAFLRQGRVLAPNDFSMAAIQSYRDILGNPQMGTPQKRLTNSPWWHFFLLKHYLPQHQIDYLVLLFFGGIILYSVYLLKNKEGLKRIPKSLYFFLLLLGILFFQKFLVIQIYGDRFIIPQTFNKLLLKEGVVLSSTPAYAAPSRQTQETILLSPGTEIILFPNTAKDEWILVEEPGKRKGWIIIEDNVFMIKK